MLTTHESGQEAAVHGDTDWGTAALRPEGNREWRTGPQPSQARPGPAARGPGGVAASRRLVQAVRIRTQAALLELRERRLKVTSRAGTMGVQPHRLSTHEKRELEQLFRRLAPPRTAPIDAGDPQGPSFRSLFADPLAEIGRRGGPQSPDEDRRLADLYRLIWEGVTGGCLGFRQFVELLAAEGPKYAIDSPCYDVLFRTAGYAGSSKTIQLMHDNLGIEGPAAGGPASGHMRFINDRASTRAVRDRAMRSAELALETLDGVPDGNAELASFAGGTAGLRGGPGSTSSTWTPGPSSSLSDAPGAKASAPDSPCTTATFSATARSALTGSIFASGSFSGSARGSSTTCPMS
jgi:hypothetical protein